MEYEVTFTFGENSQSVTVFAATEEEAIAKARDRYSEPDETPATARYTGNGGKRKDAGVKKGSKRTTNPRNVKKQIRWTKKEWAQIEAQAAGYDNIGDYQRGILLSALSEEP